MIGSRALRASVSQSVSNSFGDGGNRRERLARRYAEPPGDSGWFGPSSVAWKVHGELGSMLVGGFSALLLQTLHPLVMQGVADHSNYRSDPLGRLRRTADFIAATTYGGDAAASQAVAQVRAIHRRVRGTTSTGEPYRASDPSLLTYVHVTEAWSFLRAYQRYSVHPMLREERDRYLAEMAIVARRLGARHVPTSEVEVVAYLREVRPDLRATPAAAAAVRFLRSPIGGSPAEVIAHATVVEAAIDLLPPFARRELGLRRPGLVRLGLVRPAATTLSLLLHFSLGESPVRAAALERSGLLDVPPASLAG